MRTVLSAIFKYLAWALLIIVVLLYLENADITTKAGVILGGTVAIDIIVGIAKLIFRVRDRRKKRLAEKKMREKLAAERAEALKQAAAERAEAVKDAARDAGTAVKNGASDAWSSVKGGFSNLGSKIREGLAAIDDIADHPPRLPALGDGRHKNDDKPEE